MQRLSFVEYFMEIAKLTAKRSPCLSRQVGAVLTINNRIIATGYNGPISKLEHCKDICKRKAQGYISGTGHEICGVLHAEINTILSCATTGTKIENATLYCTNFPCSICMRAILNLDIHTIIYDQPYPDQLSLDLLQAKGYRYIPCGMYHKYTTQTIE
jgi:dCMP deaminase